MTFKRFSYYEVDGLGFFKKKNPFGKVFKPLKNIVKPITKPFGGNKKKPKNPPPPPPQAPPTQEQAPASEPAQASEPAVSQPSLLTIPESNIPQEAASEKNFIIPIAIAGVAILLIGTTFFLLLRKND